jgi:hypothetical protein
MAFERKVKVVVRSQASRNGDTWHWTETEISDLDLAFRVSRSIVFNDNTAEVTIYNAGTETRNKVLRPGSNILIHAGYADEGMGLVFLGNITEVRTNRDGTDWVTSISAQGMRSQEKPFQITPVAFSFAPETPVSQIVDAVGQVLGLVLVGASMLDFTLPNGWTYVGTIKGALDYCGSVLRANKLGLYVDLGELIVYREGSDSNYEAMFLDFNSGLLSIRDVTEGAELTAQTIQAVLEDGNEAEVYGAISDNLAASGKKLELTTIMLPKARPNGLVQVNVPEYSGVYLIETLDINGDNMGGEFSCSMEVSEE